MGGIMPVQSHLLDRAIQLNRQGRCEDARRVVQALIKQDPKNVDAWLMYLELQPDPILRQRALDEGLRTNPDSQRLNAAAGSLQRIDRLQPIQKPPLLRGMEAVKPAASRPKPSAARSGVHAGLSKSIPAVQKPSAKKGKGSAAGWLLVPVTVLLLLVSIAGYLWMGKQYTDLAHKYKALSNENNLLSLTYTNLLGEYDAQNDALISLQGQYSTLDEAYSSLDGNYNGLRSDFETLSITYTTLVENYNVLVSSYQTLNTDYGSLYSTHESLVGEHNNLQLNYNDLLSDYGALQQAAITPPYIYIYNREVFISFYTRENTIKTWTFEFKTLEQAIERGSAARRQLSQYYFTFELPDGTKRTFIDYRGFVESSDFESYLTNMYWSASSDMDFIEEVWFIVSQLSTYSSDVMVETPRFPLETFLAGGGDCEDTAILFASMIMAAPVDWEVDLIIMDADHYSSPEEFNHVAVLIDTGEGRFVVETTSDYTMLWPDGVSGVLLPLND